MLLSLNYYQNSSCQYVIDLAQSLPQKDVFVERGVSVRGFVGQGGRAGGSICRVKK